MDKHTLKSILYGSIYELAKDKRYYYHSPFGTKYSHFTKEGNDAVLELLSIWVDQMLETEKQARRHEAKDLVLKELKGENTQSA